MLAESMKLRFTILFLCSAFLSVVSAQETTYKIGCIGFYNFENLFHPSDEPEKRDSEFTPAGDRAWTMELYQDKLNNLASVVSEIGTDLSPDGVALLGVAEIENRQTLEDFVLQEKIKSRNYKIVHFGSPDKRGIDVGLLYQPKYFDPVHSEKISMLGLRSTEGDTVFTRDVLYVKGSFDGDIIHVYVNHWPSRSGGEKRSRPRRNYCASQIQSHMDSIRKVDKNVKIVVMGDLNDDPMSPSVRKHIKGSNKENLSKDQMYNPMIDLYKKGKGTLAWRDAWNLFDQILYSPAWLKDSKGYSLYKTRIYNKRYMVQKTGRYKGYPFRTFDGDMYVGGYSDHYPVYSFLIKPVE